jgi:RNA polymerase sigma-70 factor (ECF subfamily)
LGGTAALMSRVAQRDESALGELYDATSRLVYGLVLRLVHEPSTAEDLTMEVYLQVWRTAQGYNTTRGSVNSWLIMIARSRAIDYLRSSHARFARHRQSLDTLENLRDAALNPQAEYNLKQQVRNYPTRPNALANLEGARFYRAGEGKKSVCAS